MCSGLRLKGMDFLLKEALAILDNSDRGTKLSGEINYRQPNSERASPKEEVRDPLST